MIIKVLWNILLQELNTTYSFNIDGGQLVA
jgi:hypothetical protein